MVWLHLSFPSQWCGCTSLSLLNGAATPLSSLSMVRLHISLLSHWCGCTFLFSLNSISITLSINLYYAAPLHIWSPSIIFPKHSHFLPYAQHFFFFNVLKTSFPKKPFLSQYLPQKPSSFIYNLFSPFMPQIHPSKTSVIPSHECPLQSFPLTPPTWKDHSLAWREPTIIYVMLSHLPKNILHAISCVSYSFFGEVAFHVCACCNLFRCPLHYG